MPKVVNTGRVLCIMVGCTNKISPPDSHQECICCLMDEHFQPLDGPAPTAWCSPSAPTTNGWRAGPFSLGPRGPGHHHQKTKNNVRGQGRQFQTTTGPYPLHMLTGNPSNFSLQRSSRGTPQATAPLQRGPLDWDPFRSSPLRSYPTLRPPPSPEMSTRASKAQGLG
jgi:hypothetical protein